MTPRRWQLLIPFGAESINSVMGFGVETAGITALKHRWENLARTYLVRMLDERALPERFPFPVRLTFRCFFSKRRVHDDDNYFVMAKGIGDAFTALGLIRDDSHTFVNFGGIDFHLDRERPRVVVEIEELAPFPISDDGAIVEAYAAARHHQP